MRKRSPPAIGSLDPQQVALQIGREVRIFILPVTADRPAKVGPAGCETASWISGRKLLALSDLRHDHRGQITFEDRAE